MIYLKLLLTALLWGGTFIAGRVVAQNIDPYAGAFYRFLIATLCLLALLLHTEGGLPKLRRQQLLPLLLLGLSGVFAYNVFFFSGLHHIQASRASLIIALNPVAISLASALIFKEQLTAIKLAGIIISVSGALIVITEGHLTQIFTRGIGIGEFYIFGCVASWVTYSLIGKSVMNGLSPLAAVTTSAMVGCVLLAIPAISRGALQAALNYTATQWSCLIYLGFFGTALGFRWYYDGIKAIGPMKAGVFINFVPVSAVILAALILEESITASLFLGALLVISGVYTTNNAPRMAEWKWWRPTRHLPSVRTDKP